MKMGRVGRWIWVVVGAVAITGAVLILYLSVLLSGENLRARAETTLSRAVGRPVSIRRLDVAVWTGHATAEGLSVAEDPRFGSEPFVRADRVRIGIEMLPLLLHREVHFDSFVLERPAIRLVRDVSGVWNVATLGKPKPQTPVRHDRGRSLPDLEVSDIAIEVGSVLVRTAADRAGVIAVQDRRYQAIDLRLTRFSMSRPFSFRMSAALPEGGRVDISGTAGPVQGRTEGEMPVSAHVRVEHLDLVAAGVASPSSAVSGRIEEVAFDLAGSEQGFRVSQLQVQSPTLRVATKARPEAESPGGVRTASSVWNDVLRRLAVQQATVRHGALTVVRQDGRIAVYRHLDLDVACWCDNTWSTFRINTELASGASILASGRLLVPRREPERVASPLSGSRQQAGHTANQESQATLMPQEIDSQFRVHHLDLRSSGLLSHGSALSGLVETSGHVQANAESFRVSGTARIDHLELAKDGVPSANPVLASFDVVQGRRGAGQAMTGTVQHATFNLGAATIHVAGWYETGGPTALVNLRASGEAMPIDQIEAFLPTVGVQLPQGSRLSGGTLSTSLAISGISSNLTITGPVEVANTHLMGFDLGAKLSSLSKFTGGRLGSTGSSGTSIRSLRLLLHTGNGQVVTDKIVADIAGVGGITGAGSVGAGATLHYSLLLKLNELAGGTESGVDVARDAAKNLPGPWASRALSAIDYLTKGPLRNGVPVLVGGTARHPTVTPNIGALLPPSRPRH